MGGDNSPKKRLFKVFQNILKRIIMFFSEYLEKKTY